MSRVKIMLPIFVPEGSICRDDYWGECQYLINSQTRGVSFQECRLFEADLYMDEFENIRKCEQCIFHSNNSTAIPDHANE
jgi:hypothetical protein